MGTRQTGRLEQVEVSYQKGWVRRWRFVGREAHEVLRIVQEHRLDAAERPTPARYTLGGGAATESAPNTRNAGR